MTLQLAWLEFLSDAPLYETLVWTLVALMLVIGFLGTFLPLLPGTTLVFAGGLVFYFAMGMESSGLAWQGLVFMGLLYGLSVALDWVAGALGAKWFGSSKWGIAGAVLGAVVGLFFGLPGIIVGPIVGVFAFELVVARKRLKEAGQSTVGTVVGGLAGMAGKVALALGMIAWFVVDVFFVN
jgi:uncharacterized protein YqgC (DUF456 family)